MDAVIVTGVSRGLGAALARELVERGATVLGVGRATAPGLENERYRFAACDLADVAGLDAALAPAFHALAALGPKRVCLVNNAATTDPAGLAPRHDSASVARSIAINLSAPSALCSLFLRDVRRPEGRAAHRERVLGRRAQRDPRDGLVLPGEGGPRDAHAHARRRRHRSALRRGVAAAGRPRHGHADARTLAFPGRVPGGRDVPCVSHRPAARRTRCRSGQVRREDRARAQARERRDLRLARSRQAASPNRRAPGRRRAPRARGSSHPPSRARPPTRIPTARRSRARHSARAARMSWLRSPIITTRVGVEALALGEVREQERLVVVAPGEVGAIDAPQVLGEAEQRHDASRVDLGLGRAQVHRPSRAAIVAIASGMPS